MLEIAGGIILAVCILAILPTLLVAAFWIVVGPLFLPVLIYRWIHGDPHKI